MPDLHTLKLWAIIIGGGLIILGGLVVASCNGSLGAEAEYSKFRAAKGMVGLGGALLIVGVITVYLGVTDVALLNHFLH